MPPDPAQEWRPEQIVRNEASFREINERLGHDLHELARDEPQPFICECGSRRCTETVELTLAEYRAVRAHPDRFAVCRGHVFPHVEKVVESRERYDVVEKLS